ncbi:MAG: indolepyruvate ferredoxin oxidoreductase family protein [Candidatus Heimdallarchaeota archaeon]|nr:indolepyruvate ferredoxin oxidoreductase family protein [Candidatus Heimdallarchaeota archaeon]
MLENKATLDTHTLKEYSLEDEFSKDEGIIVTSGINALVRLLIEQAKADRRRGLNTAGFVSGYRGSPLGGLDLSLQKKKKVLESLNIEFIPGVNEDLGVTAVQGSQTANLWPDPKFDGVFGMWYGKSPGLDRSGDAIKHANFTGVNHNGGVLAVVGDDPVAKSSSLPSQSEQMLVHTFIPILYPGSVEEIIPLGRLGYEMSRYSGLWTGFKIVTDIADAYATISLHNVDQITIPDFSYQNQPWKHTQQTTLLPPFSVELEKEVQHGRLIAAKHFAYANKINQIRYSSTSDTLGIITAGKTYYDMMEALRSLGIDEIQLEKYGIRILKLGMVYPLEENIIEEFIEGLNTVLVVEEKRSFIENQLKEILYTKDERVVIIGKKDKEGKPLIKDHGEIIPTDLKGPLKRILSNQFTLSFNEDISFSSISLDILPSLDASKNRIPYFCSGCPHNTSTQVPEGSIGVAGIGCHAMALLQDRNTINLAQMGGEGVSWVGSSRFSNTKHSFQNLGDGTLFHSGSLAIRQAVAANTNITYKILWNGVVAMTGAQIADGQMPLPELTRSLEAEGVKRIIVCGPKVQEYPRGLKWAKSVNIWHRDRFNEAQEVLRDTKGVTVLIYDQECAANLRRLRKRGTVATPKHQVFINEAVCTGCGDCGVKSNCLSVFPVDTEFGRKTQIHQSSCNRDYTCTKGDCPAFVTIVQKNEAGKAPYIEQMLSELDELDIPHPEREELKEPNLFTTGVGGTGVVTITRILSIAAMLDGKFVTSLDQTGLSQKGGPVVAHLKFRDEPQEISNRIADGDADVFLLFDLISGTADKNLKKAKRGKTIAIAATSKIPTGRMVSDITNLYPEDQIMVSRLESYTRNEGNVYIDSNNLAENLFESSMYANMISLGAAYQRGVIPVSFEALMRAIELNRVAIKNNQRALKVGRMMVYNPDWIESFEIKRWGDWELIPEITPDARSLIDRIQASNELRALLEVRVPELIAYQNTQYAEKYIEFLEKVVAKERKLAKGFELSEAVAFYLYKLMTYKDEYEVSRLYLKDEFNQAIKHQFGEGAEINYLLHPPALRVFGWKKKIRLGGWFKLGFKLMSRMKVLRGTFFDPFGHTALRKKERDLIIEYMNLIEEQISILSLDTRDKAIQFAELPDIIRGYEDVLQRNIDLYYSRIDELKK